MDARYDTIGQCGFVPQAPVALSVRMLMRMANSIAFISILALALTGANAQSPKKNKKDTATAASNLTDPNAAGQPKQAPGGPDTSSQGYIIGSEDVLNITVIASSGPALQNQCTVRPDGYISLPLVGEVLASGATPRKLESLIGEKLIAGKMFVEPNVTVAVLQFNSRKVYISGDGIAKPGSYPLVVPTKVSELLTQAGGFRDFANKKKITILRGKQILRYNDNEVSRGKNMEQDILLQPGDHIYVK